MSAPVTDGKIPSISTGYLNRTASQPVMGVKRGQWRDDGNHSKLLSEEFASLRLEVLQRDNYSCRFCGFKSAKFQEFHHFDGDHENCTKDNLMTACNLCHQVHHLAACGMSNKGFLISNQELTQTEINNIARAIYVNEIIGNQETNDKLLSLMASVNFRGSDTLKTIFSSDIITTLRIAEILANPNEISDEVYAKRVELLAPLRLFPTKNAFVDGQLEYYAQNNKTLFLPENWLPLTRQLVS